MFASLHLPKWTNWRTLIWRTAFRLIIWRATFRLILIPGCSSFAPITPYICSASVKYKKPYN